MGFFKDSRIEDAKKKADRFVQQSGLAEKVTSARLPKLYIIGENHAECGHEQFTIDFINLLKPDALFSETLTGQGFPPILPPQQNMVCSPADVIQEEGLKDLETELISLMTKNCHLSAEEIKFMGSQAPYNVPVEAYPLYLIAAEEMLPNHPEKELNLKNFVIALANLHKIACAVRDHPEIKQNFELFYACRNNKTTIIACDDLAAKDRDIKNRQAVAKILGKYIDGGVSTTSVESFTRDMARKRISLTPLEYSELNRVDKETPLLTKKRECSMSEIIQKNIDNFELCLLYVGQNHMSPDSTLRGNLNAMQISYMAITLKSDKGWDDVLGHLNKL